MGPRESPHVPRNGLVRPFLGSRVLTLSLPCSINIINVIYRSLKVHFPDIFLSVYEW